MELEILPKGWKWETLENIATVVRGASPRPKGDPRYFGGSIPWIMISDISREKGKYISKTKDHVTEGGAKLSRLLNTGTLILSNSGTICVPKILAVDGCIHDGFIAFLDLKHDVDKLYLYYYLDKIRPIIMAENQRGVTQVNLNTNIVKKISIPLPPLPEQRRIVARVEALLSQVNAARKRLNRVPLIMKRFRQVVLAAACSGRLTEGWREEHPDVEHAENALNTFNRIFKLDKKKIRKRGTLGMPEIELPDNLPKSWTIKKIKELVDIGAIFDYQDGNHGELYPRQSDFGEVGVKFLTATQVFDNKVQLAEAPLLKKEKALQLRIGFAQPRDVLLTHNATVGRVALMPDNCGEIILGTSVTYYRLNPEFIDPNYCCFMMQGPLWQSQLRVIMEQTTRNQVSITKQAEFFIPIPPILEQHEIVRHVNALFMLADQIEHQVAGATKRTEALTQAVLAKAFQGELVATDAELSRKELE